MGATGVAAGATRVAAGATGLAGMGATGVGAGATGLAGVFGPYLVGGGIMAFPPGELSTEFNLVNGLQLELGPPWWHTQPLPFDFEASINVSQVLQSCPEAYCR